MDALDNVTIIGCCACVSSKVDASAMLIFNESSSVMVTIEELSAMVAFVGLASRILKVSFASLRLSDNIGTDTVVVTAFAKNVAVPELFW